MTNLLQSRTFFFPLFAFLALVLALEAGCSRRKPYVPEMRVPRRVAVLDFGITEEIRRQTKDLAGWWLGSRDVYRNENIGRIVADEIAYVLNDLPYVDLYSRLDYRYYIDGKKELLRAAFRSEEYTAVDFDRMIERVDPVEIGRDLGVDVVVAGRVERAHMGHNRAIHWSWSTARIVLEAFDVRTGESMGQMTIDESKQLSSQIRLVRLELERRLPEFDRLLGAQELR